MERTGTKGPSPKTGSSILSQTFSIGRLEVHYYGIIMAFSIALGYFLGRWKAKKENIPVEQFENIAFWTVLNSFIAARIYYFFLYRDSFQSFIDIFKIWNGGLGIYGAIIGGLLTLIYFARKYSLPILKLLDIGAFAMPLSQAVGRFGNYINYEAFGNPTNLPWKMFVPKAFRPLGYENFEYFHPTFVYESITNVIIFIILFFISKKYSRPGLVFSLYLVLYGLARFFIESIRLDSSFILGFRADQATSLLLIFLGFFIIMSKYVSQNR